MARKKRSVALFEVIQKDKRFQRKTLGVSSLRAPGSWFGRREPLRAIGNANAGMAPVAEPTHEMLTADPTLRPLVSINEDTASPSVVTEPARPKPRGQKRPAYHAAMARRSGPSAWTVAYQKFIEEMKPRWRRLQISMAGQSGLLTGASAAAVVIMGVLIARHITPSAATSTGVTASIEQLRSQAAHPSVLEVAGAARTETELPATLPPDGKITGADAQPATNTSMPARQVNLNYVVIQSYGDQKTATDARDFLMRNGIFCSIERGVKNWRKDFYQVVGSQGFTRVSGPDYQAYRGRISALSAKFAPSHGYREFAPQAVKWDRVN